MKMSDLPPTYVDGFHDAALVSKMTYHDFGNTGMKVSKLSFGAGGFSDIYGQFSVDECRETLLKALKSGINYIDTAPWYGQGVSEETLGKCLQGIPRQAYYIATKVGRYEKDPAKMFDFSSAKTRQSIEISLAKLGIDYVDVIQIHDIEFAPSLEYLFKETLPVLKETVDSGKAKFIGVTGYPVSKLAEFISKSPIPIHSVLSYSRLTLMDATLMEYLDKFENLGVINAASLAMGLLTNGGPQPWAPAHQDIKDVCQEAREYCKKYDVELAKIAMDHVYRMGDFPQTHLVGMNNRTLLDSNLDVLFNGLSDHEKKVAAYLQTNIFTKLKHRHWEGVEKY